MPASSSACASLQAVAGVLLDGFRITALPAAKAGAILWATVLSGELNRSEEHTSELQSLMRISYAVFCLKKKKRTEEYITNGTQHSGNKTNITNRVNTHI